MARRNAGTVSLCTASILHPSCWQPLAFMTNVETGRAFHLATGLLHRGGMHVAVTVSKSPPLGPLASSSVNGRDRIHQQAGRLVTCVCLPDRSTNIRVDGFRHHHCVRHPQRRVNHCLASSLACSDCWWARTFVAASLLAVDNDGCLLSFGMPVILSSSAACSLWVCWQTNCFRCWFVDLVGCWCQRRRWIGHSRGVWSYWIWFALQWPSRSRPSRASV